MNPLEKEELEKMIELEKVMNNPLVDVYHMLPRYTFETYSTGQDKRRARRKQERKNKKK